MRQGDEGVAFERDATVETELGTLTAPILARTVAGLVYIVVLSGPLTTDQHEDPVIADYRAGGGTLPVIVENELMVRGNLPAATRNVQKATGVAMAQ